MKISEIEQYLKGKNEHFPSGMIETIEKERLAAIQEQDELKANHYWCLAVIAYIQQGFVSIYQLLKNRKYQEAWEKLKETDIQMTSLEQNFPIGTFEEDDYHLVFIKNTMVEYEKLFPYEYFICRESVIKEQRCTICGETVKLRGGCKHVPGKIYMGELCMHQIINMEYLNMKVTQDPFDKYEILKPYISEQLNYNFDMLDSLMQSMKTAYDYWYVDIVKEKNPEFARIGRNDKCPCGSGKKFKHCCMNDEEKMYFDHYKICMMNDINETYDQSLHMIHAKQEK